MTETYRLVFRGEVIEGQHPAVVRKRLAMALKLDDERVASLFSGSPVVIRKTADEETATRFQAVFKKAGARLRVIPVPAEAPAAETSTSTTASEPVQAEAEWVILPAGSDLLEPEHRAAFIPRNIDTSHLALVKMVAFAAAELEREKQEINAPEYEVLPVGSQIGEERVVAAVELDVDFELAEVGANIGVEAEAREPAAQMNPDFELAAPGELMQTRPGRAIPPAPDVSHLSVIDQP